MTRKDYVLIAKIIRENGLFEVAEKFAEGLQEKNQNFDRERFLKACK